MTDHTTDVPLKQCCVCKESKPVYFFDKHKGRKDGHNSCCKKCRAAREGRDYIVPAKPGNKFCSACKKELPATTEHFYTDSRYNCLTSRCKTCTRTSAKKWGNEHTEYVREKAKKWAKNNYKRFRDRIATWIKNNPKKVRTTRAVIDQNRRARQNNLPSTFTTEDWRRAIDYFGNSCAVCGRPLNGLFHTAHADHWIPISDPRSPGTTPQNIIPLCGGIEGCNNSKHNKNPERWLVEKFGKQKSSAILKRINTYFEWTKQQT